MPIEKPAKPKNQDNSEKSMRALYILQRLISADFVKADQLAEELFISKSLLTGELKLLRAELETYDLELKAVPHYGLSLGGSEWNKRRCLSYFLRKSAHFDWYSTPIIQNLIPMDIHKAVGRILKEYCQSTSYMITDDAFKALQLHIAIMVYRIRSQSGLSTWQVPVQEEIKQLNQAQDLLDQLEREFQICINENEQEYLQVQLAGKRYYDEAGSPVVTDEIMELVSRMLARIKEHFHTDFFENFDLRIQLGLHLVPLLMRLKYHINMTNSLLGEIKSQYLLPFDMAIEACHVLEEEGYQISEDEISYLALYITMALDQKVVPKKKRILIVCQSSKISAKILRQQLKSRFSAYISQIEECPLRQLTAERAQQFDYVFATTPIDMALTVPVIQVQQFLNESQFHHIGNALNTPMAGCEGYFDPQLFITDCALETREEIIVELTKTIGCQRKLPADFLEKVLLRESYGGTDFGNMVAVPHPTAPVTADTFICVCILKKPILWSREKVQLVLLTSVQKKKEAAPVELYRLISHIAGNRETVRRLLKSRSLPEFLTVLRSPPAL